MSTSVIWVEASWAKSDVAFAAVVGWLPVHRSLCDTFSAVDVCINSAPWIHDHPTTAQLFFIQKLLFKGNETVIKI